MDELIAQCEGGLVRKEEAVRVIVKARSFLRTHQQLETIFEPCMTGLQSIVAAERCTLFLYDEEKRELWTKLATSKSGGNSSSDFIAHISVDEESLASVCARTS